MPAIPQSIIAAARASQAKWKIPASVSLAQWALESGWGQYDLGVFNFFGIKAPLGLDGKPKVPFVMKRTREAGKDGKSYYIVAPFRAFASADEAFDQHGELLGTKGAYSRARAKLPDPDAFADALTGVYATDPGYGAGLRQIMRTSKLYQYNAVSA